MSDEYNLKIDEGHCNVCGQVTKHWVRADYQRLVGDHPGPEDEWVSLVVYTWEILECCGCENITMRRSECSPDGPGDISQTYYPPAIARKVPLWSRDLPFNVHTLLEEVYSALHNGSTRLAMMGARALIDISLVSRVGDVGSFARLLGEGVKQGVISQQSRNVLDAAFDAGSAAAHRGHIATSREVGLVIDIVENLLQSVYLFDTLADELRRNTPPRNPAP